VGGISYPKNETSKEKLIHKFDYDKKARTFRDFKLKFRTLNDKERKFISFLEKNTDAKVKRFVENVQNERQVLEQNLKSENILFFLFFKYFYR
jgi:ClpP class serine protease